MSKEDILELINLNYSVLLKYEEDYAKEIYSYANKNDVYLILCIPSWFDKYGDKVVFIDF